ncbi:Fe-S cluster assembly protein NifU [Maridesulfovibrio ferrireducens]|uniref:Fe-S cluster assembly protein NifU n=1 Tax=Maridesulfovibrio ferrireducens TaxID=246191 RepID=UPI001A332ADE|nr:Fe-S cluster assembly protein NifU [Maridesulfovibrio ferrireducens]MBI9111996.1 Fe-S cluster assembly protein NifU [Maridesulfovibrio ferrireducens]
MWEYTDKLKEHFLNPKNSGTIDDADAVGEVGSLSCGDALRLFLKIDDEGRIEDAKFQTFGCASAIASSSVLTEMVKGMTVEEAEKVTNKDIAEALGGLPKEKMHCSVMGQEALEDAIRRYRGLDAVPAPEGEIVCKCFGVTDVQIKHAVVENKLTTVEEVTNFTKAGGGCEDCHGRIKELIDEIRFGVTELKPVIEKPAKLTNIKRFQLVTQTIDEEIRPALHKDGGDIELIDIEGTVVIVSLRGACVGCPSSGVTLKDFVERRLKETVEDAITVREA